MAAMLCYLFTFIGGIIFLAVEKRSRLVLFHSLQSVMAFGGLMVAHVLTGFVPLIGPLVASLLSILTFVLWVVLVVQATQGKWFKLPWIGEIAERQLRHL